MLLELCLVVCVYGVGTDQLTLPAIPRDSLAPEVLLWGCEECCKVHPVEFKKVKEEEFTKSTKKAREEAH